MPREEDRLRAQTLLGTNLVVEAGAGTGKTTLLIDRLCLCVLAQGTPVEKVVALTFTEKAAAEIKTRFLFKLQQVSQVISNKTYDRTLELLRTHFAVKDSDLSARAEQALARLDRACIGTIHGFCAEILKMFPLEAGLSPHAQIDTGYREAQLFESYWNRFLDAQLGTQATHKEQWKQLLAHFSLEDLKAFAQLLSAVKPVKYDYYSHRRFLASECAQKAQRLEEMYASYMPPGKKPRNLEKALLWAATSLKNTQSFLQGNPVTAKEELCPTPSMCKDWNEEDFEQARGLIEFAQQVTVQKQQLFLAAYELINPLAQELRRTYEQEGLLSFDELIIKTRNLLQKNLYVRRVLKEKFSVLFVDEFQDTDPVQGELLLFLAEQKPGTASSWQEVKLEPGKLFVVGDPKQSIYRFRGADITAYELFTDLILKQGGKKCFLQNNFRSTPEIIEVANQVCSRAMVQQAAFQPAYVPIFTDRATVADSVEWLFITPPQGQAPGADDFRYNQAEQIARWIKQQVGKMRLKEGHLLAYRDIALLTRVGTTSRIYTDALRRHGIPFNTQTDKDFFRKQEINDLLLLLHVVADPDDSIAWAGVLRSPLGGLTDQELYEVAQAGPLALQHLLTHALTASFAQKIQHFHQLAGRISLHELIEKIFDETFFLPSVAAAYEQERSLAYLQQFVVLVQQYSGELSTFLTEIKERLSQTPDMLSLPPTDESADAVSMLTVHRSKGLEFPVVILADLSRKETGGNVQPPDHLFSWQYQMYGLRVGKIRDVNLAFLEEEQKKHSRCEEIRILYVALTRAKEKLLLVADGRAGGEKGAAPFVAAGLYPQPGIEQLVLADSNLKLPVRYVPYFSPSEFIYQPGSQAAQSLPALGNLAQWSKEYQTRLQRYEELQKTAQKHTPSERDTALFAPQQRQAAELGNVCHRALELMLTIPAQTVTTACEQAAQMLGAYDRAQEACILLEPFVKSAVFARIRAAQVLACEMPFTRLLADGIPQTGRMDVVLKTPQGIWIIDYKTDQVAAGKEQELFEQKYKEQLEAYRQAAEQLFPGQTVRVSAVFVRTFAAVEA
ncbi:MAG: UvrD-helicase domain-containing protein [Elusimicrobiaceae bacterium]|nr:UvrD-helicase domain-containing protein [Elusimicrobiaceae bacterium]